MQALALLLMFAMPPGTFVLDPSGTHGPVFFDHNTHQSRMFPGRVSASCLPCHHSRNSDGTPQLLSCHRCHFESGNRQNPRTADLSELFAEKAFHNTCMGCHRASQKGPRLCTSCHLEPAQNKP